MLVAASVASNWHAFKRGLDFGLASAKEASASSGHHCQSALVFYQNHQNHPNWIFQKPSETAISQTKTPQKLRSAAPASPSQETGMSLPEPAQCYLNWRHMF